MMTSLERSWKSDLEPMFSYLTIVNASKKIRHRLYSCLNIYYMNTIFLWHRISYIHSFNNHFLNFHYVCETFKGTKLRKT